MDAMLESTLTFLFHIQSRMWKSNQLQCPKTAVDGAHVVLVTVFLLTFV